jgi:hypothetical protein
MGRLLPLETVCAGRAAGRNGFVTLSGGMSFLRIGRAGVGGVRAGCGDPTRVGDALCNRRGFCFRLPTPGLTICATDERDDDSAKTDDDTEERDDDVPLLSGNCQLPAPSTIWKLLLVSPVLTSDGMPPSVIRKCADVRSPPAETSSGPGKRMKEELWSAYTSVGDPQSRAAIAERSHKQDDGRGTIDVFGISLFYHVFSCRATIRSGVKPIPDGLDTISAELGPPSRQQPDLLPDRAGWRYTAHA